MTEKKTGKTRFRKILFFIVLTFFICAIAAVYRSTILEGVSGTGRLRLHGWVEGTEVSLSSKVSGNVVELNVEEGTSVKVHDLVARISSEQILSRITNAEARIDEARAMATKAGNLVEILKSRLAGARIALELTEKQSSAKIRQAEATLDTKKSMLIQAETNFSKAEKDYLRCSPLAEKKTISESRMDGIEETYKVTRAELERAGREIVLAEAGLSLARSSITEIQLRKNDVVILEKEIISAETDKKIAEANVEALIAKKNELQNVLDDTVIYSPVDGTVTDKVIESGENVVQGTPLAVITDMARLYVKTYVEELNIGKVKLNDPCRIYVDTYPDRHFDGRVIYVSSKAEFTPRDVQMKEHRTAIVYKIKVGIDNPAGILKPGMPSDIDLKWDDKQPWDQ